MVSPQIRELRVQCRDRGIKFHPRHSADSLVKLLDSRTGSRMTDAIRATRKILDANPVSTESVNTSTDSGALGTTTNTVPPEIPEDVHRALIYLRRMSTRHEITIRNYIESLHAR